MTNYEEIDALFDNTPQFKTGKEQVRLRLSQLNLQYLNDLEKVGCDRNSIVNLALDMLRPKLGNYGIQLEGLYHLVKK
jgi:hypothetical protein